MLTHRNLVAGTLSVASYLENRADDVLLAALPLSFDAGFSQLTTAFSAGARVVLINYLMPRDVLQAVVRHRVTGLTAVLYPGLPDHPGHAIAAGQMTGGFGGMLSIRVAGAEREAMAVAAEVKVFKRATSLGGVESLIEHRRSTEGPSSPVPDDLLRLSIGLETVEDLIADLSAALDTVGRAGGIRPPLAASERLAPSPAAADATAAVTAVVERSLAPSVIARGGAIRVVSVDDRAVILEASGSPGAILPATAHLEALLRPVAPPTAEIRVVWAGAGAPTSGARDLAGRVHQVLDDVVNPAVASHGGRVSLVDVADGRARIRLEGGCQGCAQAEVTVRQGIERLLRERCPEISGVVDVTDHPAGTAPFFPPGKR
jgi:Fe-S cluster biogenesis protein NfuA